MNRPITPCMNTYLIHTTLVEQHDCDVCNATYMDARKLEIHKRVHSGDCPFSCTVCSKAFTTARCLKVPIRKTYWRAAIQL